MKERPILFSAPMVRAILDGRKTQTRRVVKPGRDPHVGCQMAPCEIAGDINNGNFAIAPYGQRGDRLWVREAHQIDLDGEGQHHLTLYRADYSENDLASGWRPSIHMPRWASRITLEITAVRVERLQNISEADAMAEGIVAAKGGGYQLADTTHYGATAVDSYASLFEHINGPHSWDKNPWVWVLEFKRV